MCRTVEIVRRTDLMDTSVEAHKRMILLLREKGPEWRLRRTFELSEELKLLVNALKKSVGSK